MRTSLLFVSTHRLSLRIISTLPPFFLLQKELGPFLRELHLYFSHFLNHSKIALKVESPEKSYGEGRGFLSREKGVWMVLKWMESEK